MLRDPWGLPNLLAFQSRDLEGSGNEDECAETSKVSDVVVEAIE